MDDALSIRTVISLANHNRDSRLSVPGEVFLAAAVYDQVF